jgi:hypothetical protein
MKQNKKQNENRNHSQQKPLRKFARRPKDLDRLAPLVHEVIIKLDAHAAKNLFLSPLGIDGLSLGPEETSLVLRATVTLSELLKIASWAYSMGTHVTVRSPWFLRETAKLKLHAPHLVGLINSFAA